MQAYVRGFTNFSDKMLGCFSGIKYPHIFGTQAFYILLFYALADEATKYYACLQTAFLSSAKAVHA